jgi:hypothetical protein
VFRTPYSSRGHWRTAVTGMVAGALVLTGLTTPASAAAPTDGADRVAVTELDREDEPTPDHGGSTASAFLRTVTNCFDRQVVFSGGAQVAREGSHHFQTVIQESAPGDNAFGPLWLVAMSNQDPQTRTIFLKAVCADPPPGYHVEHADYMVAGNGGTMWGAARCPGNRVVFGGGAQVAGAGSSDFQTVMRESGPPNAQSWMVAMENNGPVSQRVRVLAVCADAPPGYMIAQEDRVVLGFNGNVRTNLLCPADRVVLGGGVQAANTGNVNTVIRESTPGIRSGQSGWFVSVANTGIAPRTVIVSAICAFPPPGYSVRHTEHTLAPG